MNERIRELIVRLVPDAFMTYKGYLYHSGDPKVLEHSDPEPLYTRQELEKFAELIVRECIKESLNEIVSGDEIAQEKDPLNKEYLKGNNQGIVDAVVRFRNHFGVEE